MKTFQKIFQSLVWALVLLHSAGAGDLAQTPLSLKGGVPPNVMFALSVEFPTANTAAYQGASDYSRNNDYLGYFDNEKCYRYSTDNGYFSPIGRANDHQCDDSWSGNFLNWATMTGLDEFRYAMTGGHRATDTSTLTVLERSYQSGQGGTSNFPDKTFTENGNTTPWGSGTRLTIRNQGLGVQMNVTANGSGLATCNGPTKSGSTFSCTSITLADGTTGNCTAWTGDGTTSAKAHRCTAFSAFGSDTPSSATVASTSSANTGSSTNTVSCTNASLNNGSFSCTLQLDNATNGTCKTWGGDGTSGNPYKCLTFNSFGSYTFSPGGGTNTTSHFDSTVTSGDKTASNVRCTVANVSGSVTTTCTFTANSITYTASCAGSGSYSKKSGVNYCSSFGMTPNSGAVTATYVSSSRDNSTTTVGNNTYADQYDITYRNNTSSPVYYVSSYPGSTVGSNYYYASTYNLAFGESRTYNVRVKVCDSDEDAGGREDNCRQFGSAYKPTGVIQDNGDTMRFGVMSYFQANDVDNAVLRSKMKYVAPTKYSTAGNTIANPNKEWSATDGTLLANPDSSDSATANSYVGATSKTGVINYINQFGSTSHSYKTYDPVNKLYYEALKYLRGKAATTDFYNGATSSNNDGFPVISNWDNPIQYSCQKNYIITMGDTHTWCDKRLPGGTHTSANNSVCNAYTNANSTSHVADFGSLGGDSGLDVSTQMNRVGALEGIGNIATNYTGAGGAGYGMAGMAHWAASNDIRPDLLGTQKVQTFIIDVQENKDCGFRSSFWLAAKYGNPASYSTTGNWLTTSDNPAMVSLPLPGGACSQGAPTGYAGSGGAVNWPKNLLRAGDPQSMISAVKSAIAEIAAQAGDEAALAQSSGSLDTGTGAYIYQASYETRNWQGDVRAYSINTSAEVGDTPAWKASSKLPAHGLRYIYTFNDGMAADGATAESAAKSRRGILFKVDGSNPISNFSSYQQAMLNKSDTGIIDNNAEDRINWLRGDQSKEATLPGSTTPNPASNGWRSRVTRSGDSLLGDFINSNPVYVAAPSSLPDTGFKNFADTYKNRKKMLYVGSNDGMLHAFDASYTMGTDGNPVATASSGKELFAYVPSAIYGNLNKLMSQNYSHRYFVDGSPVVADACFGNSAGGVCSANWKTMLVGGLNAGGQGIYALDITDPSKFEDPDQFLPSGVLWEFTDKDDPHLGYTFGKPVVRKLNNNKWAVIFGSGYNNTEADSKASTTGRAYLYILYVDGPGAGNAWTLGTDYFRIELKSPSESAAATLPLDPPNGIGSIAAIDKDQNGTTDIVYAGDRNGNLWKIDLTSTNSSLWKAAFGTTAAPQPLFTATSSGSAAQQITTGIEVARHPNGGFMVMFGSGSWIEAGDPLTNPANSFYGIWDKDDGTRVTRTRLQQQKIITNVTADGTSCTAGSANCFKIPSKCEPNYSTDLKTQSATGLCPADIMAPANTGQQLGWFFDFPATGERTFSNAPSIFGNIVAFNTLIPATDPCAGNTRGDEYTFDYISGGQPKRPVYVLPNDADGLIQVTIGGETFQVAPGGKTYDGGATQQGVKLDVTAEVAGQTGALDLGLPTAACAGGFACNSSTDKFIPGFGFLHNNLGGTSKNKQKYVVDCTPRPLEPGVVDCKGLYKPGQWGRINWKQVNR